MMIHAPFFIGALSTQAKMLRTVRRYRGPFYRPFEIPRSMLPAHLVVRAAAVPISRRCSDLIGSGHGRGMEIFVKARTRPLRKVKLMAQSDSYIQPVVLARPR